MRFLGERCKMVVEPTGCVGLMAIRRLVAQGVIVPGERVATILSGGNIGMQRYASLVAEPEQPVEAIKSVQKSVSLVSASTNASSSDEPSSPRSVSSELSCPSSDQAITTKDKASTPEVDRSSSL